MYSEENCTYMYYCTYSLLLCVYTVYPLQQQESGENWISVHCGRWQCNILSKEVVVSQIASPTSTYIVPTSTKDWKALRRNHHTLCSKKNIFPQYFFPPSRRREKIFSLSKKAPPPGTWCFAVMLAAPPLVYPVVPSIPRSGVSYQPTSFKFIPWHNAGSFSLPLQSCRCC